MKRLLIFIFVCSCFNLQSQKTEFFTEFNFGAPTAITLRPFHNDLVEQVSLDNFETTDNFRYNYGFGIGFRFDEKISVFLSNRVSGAKTSAADYSGFIRLTNELNGYTLGVQYDLFSKETKHGKVFTTFKVMTTNSVLKLKTESQILQAAQNEDIKFASWDFGGGIGLAYQFKLKFLILRAHVDFDLYYGGKFKIDDPSVPKEAFLQTGNGTKVTAGWSGLNTGIGIVIPVSK